MRNLKAAAGLLATLMLAMVLPAGYAFGEGTDGIKPNLAEPSWDAGLRFPQSRQTRLWAQGRPPKGPGGGGPRMRPMSPPPLMERLKNMSPEERQQILQNNRRFQQLPKAQQQQILDRFQSFQKMPPEQRELMQQRAQIFQNLSPEQQQKAVQLYQQHWRNMPADRRRALMQEFRSLRSLPPADRDRRLSSPEAAKQFSPEERDLLKQLTTL